MKLRNKKVEIKTVPNQFTHIETDHVYEIYIDDKRIGKIGLSYDESILIALEHVYLGYNSQFSEFAMKMLGMNTEHY